MTAGATRVDVDAFWRDGYQVVTGVYTPEEIRRFREGVRASAGRGGTDLLSNPHLADVLLDGRLVDIARQILGRHEIVYAGDSSFTLNSSQHGWHKDNADREDPAAPDWQSRYTVLRFGIYLQDHTRHAKGLNLRRGSHERVDLTSGRNVYVRTAVGDVAVWSLRMTHSGNGTLVRFTRSFAPVRPGPTHWPSWAVASQDGDRMALFAALGLDDAHHDRYTDYLKTRTYMVNIWRRSTYDAETLARAEKIGLKVRDLPREIEGDETVGRNEAWAPLPY